LLYCDNALSAKTYRAFFLFQAFDCLRRFGYLQSITKSMKTLYNISVNRGLLWDYNFSPENLQTEEFF
jgi:hypothetical protein